MTVCQIQPAAIIRILDKRHIFYQKLPFAAPLAPAALSQIERRGDIFRSKFLGQRDVRMISKWFLKAQQTAVQRRVHLLKIGAAIAECYVNH